MTYEAGILKHKPKSQPFDISPWHSAIAQKDPTGSER